MHHYFPTLVNWGAPLCAIQRLQAYAINCFQVLLSTSTCAATARERWMELHDMMRTIKVALGRGCHTSTFKLNISTFCGQQTSTIRLDVSSSVGCLKRSHQQERLRLS